MTTIPLRAYQGRELTEPEILLLQYIEREREKVRLTEFEKQQQRKFLAKVGEATRPSSEIFKKLPETPNLDQQKKAASEEDHVIRPHVKSPAQVLLSPGGEQKQDEGQYRIEKDENLPATRIKKRDRSELEEDEDALQPSQYFCESGIIFNGPWDSIAEVANKEVYLPNFSLENTNTIGIKLESNHVSGWAFNLCPAEDKYLVDIMFHFNPRYKTKDRPTIVMNDRIGTWGDGAKEEIRHPRGLLANPVDLKVELRPEGFLVYANNIYVAYFQHRRDIHQFKDLKIVFIAKDDNGKQQEVKINEIWWGHIDFKREVLPPSITNIIRKAKEVQYESVTNPMAPRTIIAEGLPKLEDLEELQGLEYSLLDLFEPYQVKRVSLVTGAGIAYIKLASPDLVPKAIEEMNNYSFQDQEGVDYTVSLQPMVPAIEGAAESQETVEMMNEE